MTSNTYGTLNIVTVEELAERSIDIDGRSRALLEYIDLSAEELDILLSAIPLPDNRSLSVKIGGITYRATSGEGEVGLVEVIVNVKDACFTYPFTVQVIQSHEPDEPGEHSDSCPYSWESWPKDENGEEYFVRADEDWQYNEETEEYFADEAHRLYDVECNCEYCIDVDETYTVTDEVEFAAVAARIAELDVRY